MSLWRRLSRGLHVLTDRTAADQDVDDEVRHYVEEATDAYVAMGLSPDEAGRAARRDVGGAIAVREQVRDYGWESLVGSWIADARLTGRMLRKSPVFTIVVVGILALGSGAVTTIFSAMNALVLRPLPGVAEPSRLVSLQPARQDGSSAEQGSYGLYEYLRDRSQTLDVAAWGRVGMTIAIDGAGTAADGNMVSAGYFDVLGVRPALGRVFTAAEERTPGGHPVVVISHRFWRVHLDAAQSAIGRSVILNGHPFTVIGVAPEGFHGIKTALEPDAWVPLMMQPQLRPRSDLTNASWLWMFGRLRADTAPGSARGELAALMEARTADRPQARRARAFTAMNIPSLAGFTGGEAGAVLAFTSLLLGAAMLVLSIAGVNVATMLSARYQARQREMAVRASLGAGRARLLRHLLTEIAALFLLGSLGGYVLAILATSALERLPLPANVPVSLELSPDLRVFTFAVGITVLTGLMFGLAPALRAARRDITTRLRDDAPGSGTRRTLTCRALIIGQLAFSLLLLVGAGLFLRALENGQRIDPGFEMTDVTVAAFDPESWGYDQPRSRRFFEALRERVAGQSGVAAVSYAGRLPLMMSKTVEDIAIDAAEVSINHASVDAGYFAVLRLPLVEGRAFVAADDERAARVAVVNETLARRVWLEGSAIGRTFRFRDDTVTVVGVARDAKYAALDEATPSYVYFPLAQVWQPKQTLLVRAAVAGEALAPALRQAIQSIDPLLPPPAITTLRRAAAIGLLPQRAAAIVTGVLGATGLLLVAVGLYGIMAFSAGRRTREIGIRLALGARRSAVLVMMLGEGMRLAGLGIAAGLALAAAATPLLAPWLYGVSPLDVSTFAAMSVLFVAVALVASYLPARRAAAADPLAALRTD